MKRLLTINIEQEKNRVYGLDIMRAFAILFVVTAHGQYLLPKTSAQYVKHFLFDGVTIFFVLSGFLIGNILIKTFENKPANFSTLFNFWKRRWFRTLPNYFLLLSVFFIASFFINTNTSLLQRLSFYVFGQNLWYENPKGFFPEAWSLSVEEWFYILVPLSITLIIKITKLPAKRALLFIAVCMVVFCWLVRYYKFIHLTQAISYTQWEEGFRKIVITRLDSIMYGVIAAYIAYYHNAIFSKYKNILFALALILMFILMFFKRVEANGSSVYLIVFFLSLSPISAMLALPFLSNVKIGKGFFYKTFTHISLISYSMYLLHLSFVLAGIVKHFPWAVITKNTTVLVVIMYTSYWLLTLVLSTLLYKYFEKPMTSLREKFSTKN